MGKPFVSFIVPVYNTEEFLPTCIESVLKQTSDEWELILIDDGSTDFCLEICNRYASSDSRIKVIHKKNSGQFETRMRGISVASGRYCSGIDSDDYIEPNYVKIMQSIAVKKEYDVISCNIRYVLDTGENVIQKRERYGEYTGKEFLEYVSQSTDYSFCNKLIKTDLIRKSRYGNVPYQVRNAEDHIMICPSLCMAEYAYVIDEPLYNYRHRSGSITQEYSTRRALDYLCSTECILSIYNNYLADTKSIIDTELEAMAAAVGYCLKQAFTSGNTNNNEILRIRSHLLYRAVFKYGKTSMTVDVYIFMLIFRLRLDGLLTLIYSNNY